MALEFKRQQLSQAAPKPVSDKTVSAKSAPTKPVSPVKPAPGQDKSIFGGKDYLATGDFRWRLRDQRYYGSTRGLDTQKRDDLAKKLFGNKEHIKRSDVERAEKEIDLGKWGKYKRDFPEAEKRRAKDFLKAILGK